MRFLFIEGRLLTRTALGYVLGAMLITALLPLARTLAPPVGLTRSVYATLDHEADSLFDEKTTTVDLAFLKERDDLPTRLVWESLLSSPSHRVRWQGIWYSPREEVVDFYGGADDSVVLTVDGDVVLRRNPTVGMHTSSRTVTLASGAHRIAIDYQQHGGGRHLNVQWAPAGEPPVPLAPSRLFLEDPGSVGYWLAVAVLELPFFLVLIWAGGVVIVLAPLAGPWLWDAIVRWYRTAIAMTAREMRARLYTLGLPALLLASVPFLFGTHTLYAWNLDEFSLPFHNILFPWLLIVVGVSWGILVVPGVFFSDRYLRRYTATLFGLGILLWAQGNLWVGDYGVRDGSAINFEPLAWRVPYEFGVWLAGLVAVMTFSRRISEIAPFASLLFLVLQVVAVLFGQDAERRPEWVEPPPEISQFSSAQNVIFVVLDEFQSDIFSELLEKDRPWFDEQFSGFTYFADHAGAFPTTSLSFPAMLTGQTYRNDRPVPEFVRGAFGKGSIFHGLQQHQYEIDLASILSTAWVDDWFPDDGDGGGVDATRMTIRKPYVGIEDYRRFTARQLIEFSVFRHVPHVAKQALDRRPDWFTRLFWAKSRDSVSEERRHEARSSQAFFRQFIDRISVNRDRAVFKFIHLGIPHQPVVFDEKCTFQGVTHFSRETHLGQSQCAVNLVSEFLDTLRSLGIYDQSLIVVCSDHGTVLEPRGFSGHSDTLPRSGAPWLGSIAGTAKALMLIKPPLRFGPLTISEAPTTHADLPATTFDLLGLPHVFDGRPMFGQDSTATRRREYGMYDVDQRFPKGYLDRLDVISIEGNLLDAEAWTYERSLLSPDRDLMASTVDLGTVDSDPHLGPGWSLGATEDIDGEDISFAWGLGRRATVFFSLPSGATQLTARVSAAEDLNKVIEVEIDDRWLDRVTIRGEQFQNIVVDIPPDSERPRISSLFLHFPSTVGAEAPGVKVDWLSILPP